jgi:CHAT domain-containing protein/tetratricopeptide (TPR) repeat protein
VTRPARTNIFRKGFAAGLICWLTSTSFAVAESTMFAPPPRTIVDITAILDQQKPDVGRASRTQAAADATRPEKADARTLVAFYFRRGDARSELGRLSEAIADLREGIAIGHENGVDVTALRRQLGYLYSWSGDNKSALQSFLTIAQENDHPETELSLIVCYRFTSQVYIYLGDLVHAEEYVKKNDALIERKLPVLGNDKFRDGYVREVHFGRGRLFEARGQYREAEEEYRIAYDLSQQLISTLAGAVSATFLSNLETARDNLIASGGRVKARQGRFAEGEADARQALLNRLSSVGKYNLTTTRTIPYLSTILIEEGRYAEAEKLTRAAIEIYLAIGASKDSLAFASNLSELGAILGLQGHWDEAAKVYGELEQQISNWEKARRDDLLSNPSRIYALYRAGHPATGLTEAKAMARRLKDRVGESHFDYAVARGMVGVGLAAAGHDSEAVEEFRAAVPAIAAGLTASVDEDSSGAAARNNYARIVIESYLSVLARSAAKTKQDATGAAADALRLADLIRGQSVQNAIAGSAARASTNNPELAELARQEQDLQKQIGAQLDSLNSALALPPQERNNDDLRSIRHRIDGLRDQRAAAREKIESRFPAYSELIHPKPPSVSDIRKVLNADEALVSIYLGQDESFVWAVPMDGEVAFAAIPATRREIESKVLRLREALEPNAAMISDIPAFDVALGYELYSSLLKPVESGWKKAKNLIVVTNGALGLLPLSLLPTAPAKIDANDDPLFASYRAVPWLARKYAVTTVPSSAALRALRQLPPGKPGRSELIAFGDPLFSAEQAAEAADAETAIMVADAGLAATRGMPLKRRSSPKLEGIDSAELAMLPRLPDTADELKSIAVALRADPSKVLKLGKNANEDVVKTMDLSRIKVVAFATHGLVPGELSGLIQPALALSAPSVAGVEGDGLLTMEEILALKLDADWVVLSACNTGAGAGAGAEAASGLGLAFFYAGTRAVLVTNWSVHSQSARALVTNLFKRQADDPKLARGEALRQAMMALADGPGYIDGNGKTEFAYAHPLFWAPYSIIGDGGTR